MTPQNIFPRIRITTWHFNGTPVDFGYEIVDLASRLAHLNRLDNRNIAIAEAQKKASEMGLGNDLPVDDDGEGHLTQGQMVIFNRPWIRVTRLLDTNGEARDFTWEIFGLPSAAVPCGGGATQSEALASARERASKECPGRELPVEFEDGIWSQAKLRAG